MLVLSRKIEEGLVINDTVEITILEIKDGKVKLGIKAPKNIKIHRKEILEAIKSENKSASNIDKAILKNLPKKL